MTFQQLLTLFVYLVLLVLLLAMVAFFAGVETALTSANKLALKNKADAGDPRARRACWFIDHFESFLSTVLMGTNLVTVSFVTIAGLVCENYLIKMLFPDLPATWHETVTTVLATPVILIMGEILPKAIARQHADDISIAAAGPLRLAHIILRPTVLIINIVSNCVIRCLGLAPDNAHSQHPQVTTEDLKAIADIATEQGIVHQEAGDWLKLVIDMDKKSVCSAMTPLVEIRSLPLQAKVRDVETLTKDTSFSIFPVYEGRVDNIVGIISLRHLMQQRKNSVTGIAYEDFLKLSIAPMVTRSILFVPETMSLNTLRGEFKDAASTIAIVVDEYGGMIGMVTPRDLVRQIVGSIRTDHYDIHNLPDGSIECDGKTPVQTISQLFGEQLDNGEFETVAGFILKLARHLPTENDSFVSSGLKFTIVKRDLQRISRIRIQRQDG